MVCYQFTVLGKVQGVFYRASTKSKAIDLALCGWVRNQSDGSVLMEVEGPREKVNDMLHWCRQGPVQAEVEKVLTNEVDVKNYKGFEVRY